MLKFDKDSPKSFRMTLVLLSGPIDLFWEAEINCWPDFSKEITLSSNTLSVD